MRRVSFATSNASRVTTAPSRRRVERQRVGGQHGMRPSRNRQKHDRAGYVLVLFVMLLFGIFAMVALVIDIGFARLAQRQMQTAADSAALEGLRYVDSDGRQRAGDMAAWTFDDDLELKMQSNESGGRPRDQFL